MKKTALFSAIAIACSFAATTAYADFPNVVIDSQIILNYDQNIDLSGTISIPQVDISEYDATINVNQFNHASPVTAIGSVINNQPTGADGETITDIQVDVSAIANNASVTLAVDGSVIGNVQGNQDGGATAIGNIDNNRIDLADVTNEDGEIVPGIVELNVTAVGNNLSIKAPEDTEIAGTVIGSMQFNYESPVTATGTITGNGFGTAAANPVNPPVVTPPPVNNDPVLKVSALGNNLSGPLGSVGAMTQINRNSPISASGLVSNNLGNIGPIEVSVTAVGNNISIGAVSDGG